MSKSDNNLKDSFNSSLLNKDTQNNNKKNFQLKGNFTLNQENDIEEFLKIEQDVSMMTILLIHTYCQMNFKIILITKRKNSITYQNNQKLKNYFHILIIIKKIILMIKLNFRIMSMLKWTIKTIKINLNKKKMNH